MRKVVKLLSVGAVVLLALCAAFSVTVNAAVDKPAFTKGDWYKYYTKQFHKNYTTGACQEVNLTLYYNVTDDDKNVYVNGSHHNVYLVEAKGNGTIFGHMTAPFDMYIRGKMNMNMTIYLNKTDLSAVWTYDQSNTSMDAFGWSWSETYTFYLSKNIEFEFPFDIGDIWYNNYSYYSQGHSKSKYMFSPITESWYNDTYYVNNSYEVFRSETVGSYDCLVMESIDMDHNDTPPTYIWYSEEVGNYVQMSDLSELFFAFDTTKLLGFESDIPSADEVSFSYSILVDGYYDGKSLSGVPIPHPETSIPEFAFVVPAAAYIVGVAASALAYRSRRKRME